MGYNLFKKYITILFFASLGFGLAKYYVALFFIYLFFSYKKYLFWREDKAFLWFYIALNIFVHSLYLIGMDNMTTFQPLNRYFVYSFFSIIVVPIAYKEGICNRFQVLYSYYFGVFIFVILIVVYNIINVGRYSAYGYIVNPLNDEVYNSPGYSNVLAVCFCVILAVYYSVKMRFVKIMFLLFLLLCVFSGVYLGGRAFFLVVFIYLLYYLYTVLSIKNIYVYVLIFLVMYGVLFYYYEQYEIYSLVLLSRFNDEGMDSPRYELWLNGMKKILDYPFGGFANTASAYNGAWYHNMWIDVARLGGWIPLLFLIVCNGFMYLFYTRLIKNKNILERQLVWFMGMIILLVMFQDVVVEGMQYNIMGYLILNAVLFSELYNIRKISQAA